MGRSTCCKGNIPVQQFANLQIQTNCLERGRSSTMNILQEKGFKSTTSNVFALYHIFLAKVLEIYEAKLPAGLLYDVTCLSMRGIWPLWPILWDFLPFLRILLWHTPTMGQPAQTWDWQRPPPRDNSLIILMSDIFSLADKKSADNRSRAPLMFTFITFIIHDFHQRRERPERD